jgi:hypothetical protein
VALQISPHFYDSLVKLIAVSVVYRKIEYVLPWSDGSKNPNLENFSDLMNSAISIQHTPEEFDIWTRSTFVNYGAYAQTRQLDNELNFPMVKLASRRSDARRHIQTRKLARMAGRSVGPRKRAP